MPQNSTRRPCKVLISIALLLLLPPPQNFFFFSAICNLVNNMKFLLTAAFALSISALKQEVETVSG